MSGAAMIRVLGPLDLLTTDGVVQLGGHHQKKLLATLVVAANHAVSIEQLAQVLWGDDVPPSRDNTIQSYVYRLRRLIGSDSISSEDHSYELRVEPGQLDALEFERLVSVADGCSEEPRQCSALCKEALSLWRGEAFGEFGDEDPFRLEVIRLSELRLFAIELKLESDLIFERPEMVVGKIEAFVQEHPYNENLWHLLIEALARSGRRVDALRALQDLRSVLGAVGLEPSRALLELEDRVVMDQLD